MEIHEAGAGNLHLGQQGTCRQRIDDQLRQLTWIAARRLGQAHGDIAGEVAMRHVAGAFKFNRRQFKVGRQRAFRQVAQGSGKQ